MVIKRGMVTLGEQDSSAQVREKIASSLKEKYDIIGPSNFEFVKVAQKKSSVLHLSKQTEFNYDVVKKLVGQGLSYIRTKVGFEFILSESHTSNSDSEWVQGGTLETTTIHSNSNGTSGIVPGTSNGNFGIAPGTSNGTSGIVPGTSNGNSIIAPDTSNGNSGIVPHRVPDNPGISSNYPYTIQQEGEQKTESPHDFFCRIVNEFPPDIVEPPRCLDICRRKLSLGDR